MNQLLDGKRSLFCAFAALFGVLFFIWSGAIGATDAVISTEDRVVVDQLTVGSEEQVLLATKRPGVADRVETPAAQSLDEQHCILLVERSSDRTWAVLRTALTEEGFLSLPPQYILIAAWNEVLTPLVLDATKDPSVLRVDRVCSSSVTVTCGGSPGAQCDIALVASEVAEFDAAESVVDEVGRCVLSAIEDARHHPDGVLVPVSVARLTVSSALPEASAIHVLVATSGDSKGLTGAGAVSWAGLPSFRRYRLQFEDPLRFRVVPTGESSVLGVSEDGAISFAGGEFQYPSISGAFALGDVEDRVFTTSVMGLASIELECDPAHYSHVILKSIRSVVASGSGTPIETGKVVASIDMSAGQFRYRFNDLPLGEYMLQERLRLGPNRFDVRTGLVLAEEPRVYRCKLTPDGNASIVLSMVEADQQRIGDLRLASDCVVPVHVWSKAKGSLRSGANLNWEPMLGPLTVTGLELGQCGVSCSSVDFTLEAGSALPRQVEFLSSFIPIKEGHNPIIWRIELQ